ncbi:MAG: DegT/DnrJ/EryC1/StrS family aminotransferase [Candidatus Lokiarchaeota archaeon]|nr:DegT/DnrJ/EryC1/StrS family aminotransferase [Candidatus Lokiarchaeota archaeon]
MTDKLAIDGGQKAVPDELVKVPWPVITDDDVSAVCAALRSGHIWGNAPNVVALEKEWANYCGVQHCHGTNGGTAALHMALAGTGVGAGDEVLVPAYSFHSSASCILHQNAIPVFVDIDLATFTIDPEKIREKITTKTKAIIAVDLFGLPANWDAINKIAKKNGLATIEDGCQAHGAAINGKKTGSLAEVAAFSLNGSKNLPGAEGGLLVTDDEGIFEQSRILEMAVQIVEGKRVYPAYTFGWNYRMNELSAALTRSRLKSLDELNAARKQNCEYLSAELTKLDGLIPPHVPGGFTHVYHMYRVRLDPSLGEKYKMPMPEIKNGIMYALNSEGVATSTWVTDTLPHQGIYTALRGYGNGCPWTCPHGSGVKREYAIEAYPSALQLVETTFNVEYFYPPNGRTYIEAVVHGFQKVWEHLDTIFG